MNNLDKQYTDLLQDILDNGIQKTDRTGTGTISVFGRQIRHKMSKGFPLLTTKKMPFKTIVTELLWFLRGDTNIKFLVDNGCNVWNGDAYKNYLTKTDDKNYHATQQSFINHIKVNDSFAKEWGELGPIYGKQWRSWETFTYDDYANRPKWIEDEPIDQIAILINELKTNPDSRRLMVNAWNVGELDQMVLPPCHYGFQIYTRELSEQERLDSYNKSNWNKDIFPSDVSGWNRLLDSYNIPTRAISLMWNQRSVDTPLGLPFNIASYGLLLEIIAKVVNMVPDELIGNLGDTHIYLNQIDGVKEQIGRIPWKERKEMLTNPYDINEFGNISPFTDPIIHHWLNYKKIPYSRRMPFPLPKLNINTEFWPTESGECSVGNISVDGFIKGLDDDNFIRCLLEEDIQLSNYQFHPAIKMPLSN